MGEISTKNFEKEQISTQHSGRSISGSAVFMIDVRGLTPVGEFGSRDWCEACASYGAQILTAGSMPHDLCWGFSEVYTCPPQRLTSPEWPQSGYYFMVENGVVSSGVDIPEECLATPGFHASIRWAFVCNQSKTLYGAAGQKQRGIDETKLMRQMTEYLGFEPDLGGVSEAVWPAPVVSALTVGVEEGAGLHNIAATLQSPSPEFADLPTTELGVPDFSRMTYTQKDMFVDLCRIDRESLYASAEKMGD